MGSQIPSALRPLDLDSGTRCGVCEGVGVVKTAVITCGSCGGKGCSSCGVRESGYDQMPWTECEACIGTGSADQNVARSCMGLAPLAK
jgi:DnaJ-class molecular chaperone